MSLSIRMLVPAILIACFAFSMSAVADDGLQTPTLFAELPDQCPTPDGMAVSPDGMLVVACPNYADQTQPACLIRLNESGQVEHWVDVPVLKRTGVACPMGICFGPEGEIYIVDNQGWSGSEEGQFKGRILRLTIEDGAIKRTRTIARGMEHPNGIRYRDGQLYVTQSMMSKVDDPSGKLVSGVYRFPADARGIVVENTLDDPNLILSVITENADCQYGLDGLAFDKSGDLFLGNFGDGTILKATFDENNNVEACDVWAADPEQMRTTDGIGFDEAGNLYVADFSENAVAVVRPDGTVERMAQSPDCDGSNGGLDQPGEPIVFAGRLIVTCFDIVTGPDKVNTGHDRPFTITSLELAE
jgi:hypothetical protein